MALHRLFSRSLVSLWLLSGLDPSVAWAQPADELVITPVRKQAATPPAATGKRPSVLDAHGPKLVVVLVADQFRADTIARYRAMIGAGGLQRLSKGSTAIGHYGQQNTYTGPGHALIASGAYGYLNGITQNKWYNRVTRRSEAMMFDSTARVHGDKGGDADDETSPRNLVGTTVFDELRLRNRESKVVAVALKGRGALLLGGVLLSLGVLTSPPVSPAPADVLLGANRATLSTQGARYRALCAGLQRATPARCQVFPLPTRAPRAAKLAPDADLLLWLGRDGRLSLRGCIPRLFPLGSLALPPPSGDPDAAWELQGRVFAALAAVVHAKRGGALRPVPLPPCPRSATARRRRCWGPSRATTTILSDDAPQFNLAPAHHRFVLAGPDQKSDRPLLPSLGRLFTNCGEHQIGGP